MGLAYGLVAININHLIFSKIPLYTPLPGRVFTIFLIAICGALVGRLAAWSGDVLRNLLISALTGAILSTLISYFIVAGGAHNQTGWWRILFLYILPRAAVIFGVGWLIRRVIKILEKELQTIHFSMIKMALPILGLVVMALPIGLFSIYSFDGQYALEKTNEYLEMGLSANTYEQLPAVLLPVDAFLERAVGNYTLQLSDNPAVMPVQLPLSAEGNHGYAVLVRFENGFRFGCAYVASNPEPACGEY